MNVRSELVLWLYVQGKEITTSSKEFKRLRKGVALSSSILRAPPARRFGAQAMEEHGLKWFNAKKKLNMAQKIGLMKDVWHLSSLLFVAPSMSLGWVMYFLSQRSATSP
ncbi:hypothetical protein HAX54_043986 [Datura stramonium]|uniref:Uncharacterized protein n=1 Tax=Datura stramonium TaxID=4076 RepID=A0ABS8SP48_DATST|nr:hypothetical protein [Datura stramonium]